MQVPVSYISFSFFFMVLPIFHMVHETIPGPILNDRKNINVIAYYSGNETEIDRHDIKKLTHLIYSFCHLKGNRLYVGKRQIPVIRKLVSLKKKNPGLRILLALGGWGGCETCSDVFASEKGRKEFAESVKQAMETYRVDGIDLDWEYPAVQGPQGHKFVPEDKEHFTQLITQLRKTLGPGKEISFAAGAFPDYLSSSVDWRQVMPLVDRVNLMTYDLVNRNSDSTGHHAGLYSTPLQTCSADRTIRYLRSIDIPYNKVVIGIAFYARVYQTKNETDSGIDQPAGFRQFVAYRQYQDQFSQENGFFSYWDERASAPYSYNKQSRMFATYDDKRSVTLKTKYALDKRLNGVMFWELRQDEPGRGLLYTIDSVITASGTQK
jgi:chitinase